MLVPGSALYLLLSFPLTCQSCPWFLFLHVFAVADLIERDNNVDPEAEECLAKVLSGFRCLAPPKKHTGGRESKPATSRHPSAWAMIFDRPVPSEVHLTLENDEERSMLTTVLVEFISSSCFFWRYI